MTRVTFADAHPSAARRFAGNNGAAMQPVEAETLQAGFDTEAAHLAVRRLRRAPSVSLIPSDLLAFIKAQPRSEKIGVPLCIVLFAALLFGFALVTP